ncbi:MAG: CDP-glycerol glycerophosphotransferase [Psychromonas sp.]|jgi:CDP-glycerol glycerophosphotransferase|uniref:CDP-glycerol glycerophosphotransferase family protein n=1 Tax=Psychromonas sp. TaxID=1884585 RepID=UPI0039E4C68B
MLHSIYYLKGKQHEKKLEWVKAVKEYKKITGKVNVNSKYYYRLGFSLFKLKKWNEAESSLLEAIERSPKKAQWHYRLAVILEKQKRWKEAVEQYDRAITLKPEAADWHYRKAVCYCNTHQWGTAENAIRKGLEIKNTSALWYFKLSECLRKQGKLKLEADALEVAVKRDDKKAGWFYRLGEIFDEMQQYKTAITYYSKTVSLSPKNANYHFRLGLSFENNGDFFRSKKSFDSAIMNDDKLDAKIYGIGVFHQSNGDWQRASAGYEKFLFHNPINAELRYRLALSYDRSYRWDKALHFYKSSLAFEPNIAYRNARLGFCYERLNEWGNAAAAYAKAYTLSKNTKSQWRYREGYSLFKAGKAKEACKAFIETFPKVAKEFVGVYGKNSDYSKESLKLPELKKAVILFDMLELDSSDPKLHFYLAKEYQNHGFWKLAEEYYEQAVSRTNDFKSEWYYRLAYVQYKAGDLEGACNNFRKTRILQRASGFDENNWNNSIQTERAAKYIEYSEVFDLKNQTVLYESFMGSKMSCNPFAIFKGLLDDSKFKNWIHVWVINDISVVPFKYRKLNNVKFIKRGTDLYLRYLSECKYLVNNVTFPDYFSRRKDQIYLNTWHGTPIKSLGTDLNEKLLEHQNVSRNFLHANYILTQNKHTTDILIGRYDIEGIYSGDVLEVGYPRTDLTLNLSQEDRDQISNRLKLKANSKVVLYAPTWRGDHGQANIDVNRLEQDLAAMNVDGVQLLFRGHHLIEGMLSNINLAVTTVPADIDTNELLGVVDVLITDYSSIAFDYICTGKPIIYYIHDLEEYKEQRGLYLDFDRMPGYQCRTANELHTVITSCLHENVNVPNWDQAKADFLPYDNGQVTQKVIEDVFLNSESSSTKINKPHKTSILFYAGPFIPNGIASSFLNLVNHIDKNKYDVTVVVDTQHVANFPDRQKKFEELPDAIKVIGRFGGLLQTQEEKWLTGKLNTFKQLHNQEMKDIYKKGHVREFVRTFGYGHFDNIINFEGYNRLWSGLFSSINKHDYGTDINKLVYMHNDIFSEWKIRFPHQEINIRQYEHFDKLISVSKANRDVNRVNLAGLFSLPKDKFAYCDNVQNPEIVKSLSLEPIQPEHEFLFNDNGPVFITMGRLSVEKRQDKLIEAFAKIAPENPKAKLLLLGSGPLFNELQSMVKRLRIQEKVFFLGQIDNPFSLLKRADCFVLSSDHEGQPMVLFEAMILKKAIIATDIKSCRGVLEGRSGLLVDNNSDGVAHGMKAFVDGNVPVNDFDGQQYQNNALNMFYDKLKH